MTPLLDARTFLISDLIAQRGQEQLRDIGRRGLEGFVLWAGEQAGTSFRVTEVLVPDQVGHRTDEGVYVSVAGEALHEVNVYLYEHGLKLCAQVHSHPGPAYHSTTDDTFPIATAIGSLSIVVPDFAAEPFAVERSAVYRLLASGWARVNPSEARRLLRVEP